MELNDTDLALIEALSDGLELIPQPYRALGARVGLSEAETLRRIESLITSGVIRRFGVVVHHHRLGLRANGMSVWDIDDTEVAEIGRRMGAFPFVTLCYRRPRRLPDWPYNLFAMVHGSKRQTVLDQVEQMAGQLGLSAHPHEVLFSGRQFKQRGAHYNCRPRSGMNREAAD
ncbi:Lrp/AsnC family transcriptional regulator [Magnetospira thiophila]